MVINGIRPQLSDLNENECPSPQAYLEVSSNKYVTIVSVFVLINFDQLFEKCFMHNPLGRPTFENIKKMLHKINPCYESPVDNMMLMVILLE